MSRDPLARETAALRRILEEQGVAIDPRAIKPAELVRLLNSTPAGAVLDDRRLYRHRSQAGARIGDGKSIDLFRYAAWLFDEHVGRPSAPPLPPLTSAAAAARDAYESHKERTRSRADSVSKSGRDIGPIPPIADIARRTACRDDPELFGRTYLPAAFYLPSSEHQRRAFRKMKETVLAGGLFAIAFPRGDGKSTACRAGVLWAVSYGHAIYPFLIGANEGKGIDSLDAIKMLIRQPLYVEDFPEIAVPFLAMEGIANRAHGQLCCGEQTHLRWSADRLVLPTVPCPPNWPDDWPRSLQGKAPTSGHLIGVSGLTGEGIRGSLHTTDAGEQLRPDLVLLDDPQTPESAASPVQNKKRLRLIMADVLGMAGPDKTMAALMPCTVIEPGDMADNVLDDPIWRGERVGILHSMPTNMDAWEKYFEVYRRCLAADPPDVTPANDYYLEHRDELDAGAVASWDDRKTKDDVSAIQRAMNIFCQRGEEVFYAEYMNRPRGQAAEGLPLLDPADIAARVNGYARLDVPESAAFVEAMIDVHDDVLYWACLAVAQDFTAWAIDYDTFPKQGVRYFAKRSARVTLQRKYPQLSLEEQKVRGLDELFALLFAIPNLNNVVVDEGHSKTQVETAARRSSHRDRILLSKGYGISAKRLPLSTWYDTVRKRRSKRIIRHGGNEQWYVKREDGLRRLAFDANHWKTFAHRRLLQSLGSPTGLTLYGDKPLLHQNISEHLSAEQPTETRGHGRRLHEWSLKPNRDNHWLDCVVACLVAAAVDGARLPGEITSSTSRPSSDAGLSLAERREKARAQARRR